MNPSKPAASRETVSELRARLEVAERALAARDKTIQALVTRERERAARPHSIFVAMEENTALQQVVARKTFELEAQNARLSSEIAARKQAEAAQQAQLLLLQTFLDTIPSPVFIKNAAGVYLDCNKVWAEQVMGLPKEKILGRTVFQLSESISPESATIYHEKDQWLIQHPGMQVYESDVICADQVCRNFVFTKATFANADRAIAGIVGVMLDVTKRKRAENLARQSEARYRTLIDSARDAIFTIAADGTFTSLNPAVEALTGISRADWIGRSFAPMVHPDDLPLATRMFTRVLHGDLAPLHELRGNPGLGRSALMEMTLTAQKDESGKTIGVLGIGRDITERKRAEAELAKLHQQLLATSRHAGMAEVATGVLHNVGNVLNSVNVSATLVADQMRHSRAGQVGKLAALFAEHQADLAGFLATDARGRMIPQYLGTLAESLAAEQQTMLGELDQLRRNIEHIKEIVSMQQAHGRASGVIETVALADLVEEALRMNASSLLRHDVELMRDFQLRPAISTDRHKVMQILINLLRNAMHACGESGRPDKQITVRITGDPRWVRVAIRDNGTGITRENLTRIFNHGFTTKPDGHGFGLHSGALAARELGGALTVQSAGSGHGATFTLELPLKPDFPSHENAAR